MLFSFDGVVSAVRHIESHERNAELLLDGHHRVARLLKFGLGFFDNTAEPWPRSLEIFSSGLEPCGGLTPLFSEVSFALFRFLRDQAVERSLTIRASYFKH